MKQEISFILSQNQKGHHASQPRRVLPSRLARSRWSRCMLTENMLNPNLLSDEHKSVNRRNHIENMNRVTMLTDFIDSILQPAFFLLFLKTRSKWSRILKSTSPSIRGPLPFLLPRGLIRIIRTIPTIRISTASSLGYTVKVFVKLGFLRRGKRLRACVGLDFPCSESVVDGWMEGYLDIWIPAIVSD